MLFFYDNKSDADGVVLSAGTWALPLTNLKDPRPSKKARSADASGTATRFNVDLVAEFAFHGLALTNTNCSAAAQYRITWLSDDIGTAIADTGWLSIAGYPADDPDGVGASIFHLFDEPVSARYWRFEIADEANADGFVEIGRLCMMDCWVTPLNFGTDNSEGANANTPRQNSLGGVGYFNRRKPARFFNFAFAYLPADQLRTIRRIRKLCNVDRQVIVIPDPDDADSFNETSYLATLRDIPALQLLATADVATGFQAIEVLG